MPHMDMTKSLYGCSRNMIGRRDMILWTLGRIQETCCNQLFGYILIMCLTYSRVLTPDEGEPEYSLALQGFFVYG